MKYVMIIFLAFGILASVTLYCCIAASSEEDQEGEEHS